MRKYLFSIIGIIILLVSCEKKEQEVPVSSVSITQATAEMKIGETIQLSASVQPSNATEKTVSWTSSNQTVAIVAGGKVTALAEGSSTITASCGGKSATCQVTVSKSYVAVTSVALNKESTSLNKGESETLVATVKPDDATDKTVIWSSSETSVVTVDNSGKVTAVAGGDAVITAKAGDKHAICTVSVTVPVESIALDKENLSLEEEGTATLTAILKPDDATDKTVIWSSIDPSIATVTNGGITAMKTGETDIIAETYNGKEAKCHVIVLPRSYSDLSVNGTANCYIIASKGGYRFRATVKGGTQNSIGEPVKAEVLWESFGTNTAPAVGDVISNVKYSDNYVSFVSRNNGNAVVAVKNAEDVILWSWHIWVCEGYDANKTCVSYKNEAGTMMDRNLGALTAEKGADLSAGLLYQWGRKDPFPSASNKKQPTAALTTGTWPTPVYDVSTLETDPVVTGDMKQYQIEHPMTFIRCRSEFTTSGSVWTVEKSESDPCPYGWKVPDGVWEKAIGQSSSIMYSGLWDDSNYGLDGTSLFGGQTWYPAGCELDGRTGALSSYFTGAGPNGIYWGVSSVFAFYKAYDGLINPSTQFGGGQSHGFFVRCIKE